MATKHYYATFKDKCYAFTKRIHRDSAVSAYEFTKITAYEALRQFGYTDSCSKFVINCKYIPADTKMALKYILLLTKTAENK